MAGGDSGAIELEHAIGYSGEYLQSLLLHPNRQNYVYITGACVVVGNLTDPNGQIFLRGHDDNVTCVGLSPSGSLIASGQRGYNSDVLIWDFSSQTLKYRLSEHDHQIVCLDFSHDDRLLVSCGNASDGKMFIWDTLTGYIVATCVLTPSPTTCVRFGGFKKDIKGRPIEKYQLATAGDKRIVLWTLNPYTGELENEPVNTGHVRDFNALDFTPNGERFLFAGTTSGDFVGIQMKNNHAFLTQPACSLGVTSIRAISDDNVVIGGGDGTLCVFQIQGGRSYEQNRIRIQGAVHGLSKSNDGAELLVGTTLGFQFRVRSSDLNYVLISENHTKPVTYVNFPRGISDKFATGSSDGTIRIWDGSDYAAVSRCMVTNAGSPRCFELTLEIIISGWEDGNIRAFRADNGQVLWVIDNSHKGGVCSIILSNNQRFICSGGSEGDIRVWDIRSKEMVSNLKEHTSRITDMKLFKDDAHLVSVSRDKSMLTWDLRTDKRVAANNQRIGGINAIDIAPDQNTVVTAGQERKLNKWDIRQNTPFQSVEAGLGNEGDEIYTLAISHNGSYVATGGEKMVIRIWELSSLKLVAEGHGHSNTITRISWAYDDKQIVTTGNDNCALIWNVYL
jgi:WD40 repeat protein